MSQSHFLLTFATPEKEVLKEQKVEELLCPSSKGEIHILPEHSPLIALLQPGTLSYLVSGEWKSFAVSWGYLEVHSAGVRVLADCAETGKEIDQLKVSQKIEEIHEKLKKPTLTQEEIRELEKQLELEEARHSFSKTH